MIFVDNQDSHKISDWFQNHVINSMVLDALVVKKEDKAIYDLVTTLAFNIHVV